MNSLFLRVLLCVYLILLFGQVYATPLQERASDTTSTSTDATTTTEATTTTAPAPAPTPPAGEPLPPCAPISVCTFVAGDTAEFDGAISFVETAGQLRIYGFLEIIGVGISPIHDLGYDVHVASCQLDPAQPGDPAIIDLDGFAAFSKPFQGNTTDVAIGDINGLCCVVINELVLGQNEKIL